MAEPVLFFSDCLDAPTAGWNNTATKGAAVSVWGYGVGSTRGDSTLSVGGVTLGDDAQFAEWGATTNPTTARGLQRITFWLYPNMTNASTSINVTVGGNVSNSLPFTTRTIGSNKVYYVSRAGSDANTGLTDNAAGAWQTAYKARRNVGTGDFVYFRSGTYYEEDDWNSVIDFESADITSGTSGNGIMFASYPAEVAQIGDASINHAIQLHGSYAPHLNYWTFSKLILFGNLRPIYWDTKTTSDRQDNFVRFIGNDMGTVPDSSSILNICGNSTNLSILGNYIHFENEYDDISLSSPAYGIYLKGYGWHLNTEIAWNEIAYFKEARTIQLYGHAVTDYVEGLSIHDNYLHHCSDEAIVMGGGDGGTYNYIHDVLFYNNIIQYTGNRNWVYEGAPPNQGNFWCVIKIRDDVDDGVGNFSIYNNVLDGRYNQRGEIDIVGTPKAAFIKNNVLYGNTSGEYYKDGSGTYGDDENVTEANNLYYGDGDAPAWTTNAFNLSPVFSSSAPTSWNGYIPQSTSPLIDNGTNTVNSTVTKDFIGLSRLGQVMDIGAFEYNATGGGEPAALTITTTTVPAGQVNVPYSTVISIANGQEPYTLELNSGDLPENYTVVNATKTIEGTTGLGNNGSYPIQLLVTDAVAATDTQDITLVINPTETLTILTNSLANGTNGTAYSQEITWSGGIPNYTVENTTDLPTGAELIYTDNTSTSAWINATALTAADTFPFGIWVNSTDQPALRNYTVTVTGLISPDTLTNIGGNSTGILTGDNVTLPVFIDGYDNVCAVLIAAEESPGNVTSITACEADGDNLTIVKHQDVYGTNDSLDMRYIVGLAPGWHNFNLTYNRTTGFGVGVIVHAGVNQTAPFSGNTSTATLANNVTNNINASTGQVVVTAIMNVGSSNAQTPGAGQVSKFTLGESYLMMDGATKNITSNATFGDYWTLEGNAELGIISAALRAVAQEEAPPEPPAAVNHTVSGSVVISGSGVIQ